MGNEIRGIVSLGASLVSPTRGSIAVGHRKLPKKTLVPYLLDPKTGTAMHESADIQRYLRKTYGH